MAEPKNIVLCFDGTGNEVRGVATSRRKPGGENTNVVKLFRALSEVDGPRQVAFYDPGVGTFSDPSSITAIGRNFRRILGLAFGRGIKGNLSEGYRFLLEHYEPGDRIYLFGFSRGAYTARALAGLLNGYGLLGGRRTNLVHYLVDYYWKGRDRGDEYFAVAGRFKKYFSHEPIPIRFIGLWDTVSSVGWFRRSFTLAWADSLPTVHTGRHALAIDERRSAFRRNSWKVETTADRDFQEVWFPGVHSDVGGTYPDSRAAEVALHWIATEARGTGLAIDLSELPPIDADHHKGDLHSNLLPVWWLLGWRRRQIPRGSLVHSTVRDRMRDTGYSPKNLRSLQEGEDFTFVPPLAR